MSPPMSSVRQPLAEVARRVVAALIDELRGADNTPEGVMLRPELVIREWRGPEPVHVCVIPQEGKWKWHR